MNSRTPTPPSTKTPTSAKPMSSSLKEKLRKLGRYHGTLLTPSPNTTPSTSVTMTIQSDDTRTPVLDRSRLVQKRTNLTVKMKRKFDVEEEGSDMTQVGGGDETRCKRRFVLNERVKGTSSNDTDVDLNLIRIREQIEEQKETLRKLKLVKVYRTKNDLSVLDATIRKWREVCIEALNELRDKSSMEPKPSIGQLLDHLQIDHELVRYNKEEDSFY